MLAVADIFPSENSTPESGTFDTISPISHSPGSTQHLHELKLTTTSDYNSPNTTRRLDNEESSDKTALLNPAVTEVKRDRQFSSLDTKTTHGESLPERRGFSLPLTMNSTEPGAHPEPIVKIDDKQTTDVSRDAKTDSQANRGVKKSVPPAVTKTVGESGDQLVLQGLGISLTIPPGALQQPIEITLTVVYNGKLPDLEKEESNVCPVVRCLPSGLQFNKPVVIRIPHCGVLAKNENMAGQVHINQEEEGMFLCFK